MARKPKSETKTQEVESTVQDTLASDVDAKSAKMEESVVAPTQEYRSRCGGALRAAREKQGLSALEIASRLRLSVKQIEALEADNYAALPEATTIVKGFIRNYAKQLKLDATPLLDAYQSMVPEKAPQSFTLHPSIDMKVSDEPKLSGAHYLVFGLLAAFGVGIWLFYQSYVQKPSPLKPTEEVAAPKAEDAQSEIPMPAPVAEPDVAQAPEASPPVPPPAAPVPAPAPVASTPAVPAMPSAPTTTTGSTAKDTKSAASLTIDNQLNPNQSAAPAGSARLEFFASQETWVSVTDANGKEIYSKTLFEGNRESLDAAPPLNVTVGNAQGTTLNVNGKSVDLAPHTRVNVAHIKVN